MELPSATIDSLGSTTGFGVQGVLIFFQNVFEEKFVG